MSLLCDKVGMSRQNFYKSRKVRQRRQVNEAVVKSLVMRERKAQPRIGGLKLYEMLGPELTAAGISLGRDRFFGVLRRQGLLLEPLPKGPRTTNSTHALPVFTNKIRDLELCGANEVWASDITYIRLADRFAYLSLITDMHSRKIVGYHLGETLGAEIATKALQMAVGELTVGSEGIIHHSDRGCQYCSHEYVAELQSNGMEISMTEENHCAENALAERVNGILKQEYYLNHEFKTMAQARLAVAEAVRLYNTRRPHRSLGLKTPEQVHRAAA